MMLSANPFYQQRFYAPHRPSPLSERAANAVPRPFAFSMASPLPNDKKPVLPQREYKKNPVMQNRDAATQRRRDMFFRRVQKDRDDRKWEARGEQIQRLDFVSDQKRWEAQKARQAPELTDDFIEELAENVATSYATNSAQYPQQEMSEAEYMLAQEQYELEALIAAMEEQTQQEDTVSQHFGSDDEDYDQLFMECTSEVDMQPQHVQQAENTITIFQDPDVMDMSDG